MDWNNTPNSRRLYLWKNLREDLSDLELSEQLNLVAQFFKDMPMGKSLLDIEDSINWPTPWDILFYGKFCENSTSLLIFYTFNLLEKFNHQVDLYLVDDKGFRLLVPVIDNQYALNWELGKVSTFLDLTNNVEILNIIDHTQIRKLS